MEDKKQKDNFVEQYKHYAAISENNQRAKTTNTNRNTREHQPRAKTQDAWETKSSRSCGGDKEKTAGCRAPNSMPN